MVNVCGYGPGRLCPVHQLVKLLASVVLMLTWPLLNQSSPVPGCSPAWSTAHCTSSAGASAARAPYGSAMAGLVLARALAGCLGGTTAKWQPARITAAARAAPARPVRASIRPMPASHPAQSVSLPCTVRWPAECLLSGKVRVGLGGRGRP